MAFSVAISQPGTWTDSTIVINWLSGNPRRFKTYVGNRVSFIIPPNCWNHVSGDQNPADCASRGLLPLELVEHSLWWNGPEWLKFQSSEWPKLSEVKPSNEEREICLFTNVVSKDPVIPLDRFSSFAKLVRVTAWIMKFVKTCLSNRRNRQNSQIAILTVQELRITGSCTFNKIALLQRLKPSALSKLFLQVVIY